MEKNHLQAPNPVNDLYNKLSVRQITMVGLTIAVLPTLKEQLYIEERPMLLSGEVY